MFSRSATARLASLTLLSLVAVPGTGLASQYGAWQTAINAESVPGTSAELNTVSLDGCPILSPDGLRLYVASNRTGGLGGLDIWVAERSSPDGGFGEPINVGAPINSDADDFCPTPVRGRGLLFVSTRAVAGACGGADIYFARDNPATGWSAPENSRLPGQQLRR